MPVPVEIFHGVNVPVPVEISHGLVYVSVPAEISHGTVKVPVPAEVSHGLVYVSVPAEISHGPVNVPVPAVVSSGPVSVPVPAVVSSGPVSVPVPVVVSCGPVGVPVPVVVSCGSVSVPVPAVASCGLVRASEPPVFSRTCQNSIMSGCWSTPVGPPVSEPARGTIRRSRSEAEAVDGLDPRVERWVQDVRRSAGVLAYSDTDSRLGATGVLITRRPLRLALVLIIPVAVMNFISAGHWHRCNCSISTVSMSFRLNSSDAGLRLNMNWQKQTLF